MADTVFRYGSATDVVLVGDWNGDGRDTLGVRRANDYYLTNGTTGGYADITFRYGSGSDVVIVGDWNADRIDTLGVRRVAVPRIPGDGTYRVNTDVAPGLYRTTDTAGGCYWERRSDLTGGTAGILANDFGTGPRYVQILATDVGFTTERCGTWTMVTAAYRPYPRAPSEGQWLVNRDIPAGTYRVSNAQDCYWARLSGFSGDIDEIVANDIASGTVTVTVEPTDFGFTSGGCGQWTRL